MLRRVCTRRVCIAAEARLPNVRIEGEEQSSRGEDGILKDMKIPQVYGALEATDKNRYESQNAAGVSGEEVYPEQPYAVGVSTPVATPPTANVGTAGQSQNASPSRKY